MTCSTLDAFLNSHALAGDGLRRDVADTVRAIAGGCVRLRNLMHSELTAAAAADGDLDAAGKARDLDARADMILLDAMAAAPVAYYCSEALNKPAVLDSRARLALAVDPLDAPACIETNSATGTIFSVLPVLDGGKGEPQHCFLQRGRMQLAAGFVIYGPQLTLALTLGSGTHVFTFSSRLGAFVEAHARPVIPPRAHEFAIDASGSRHWHEAMRLYIDDCIKGTEGPRDRDFEMCWSASLVADAYRVLMRGGVFLDPADTRDGRSRGRTWLVFEANPIAMLIEQAGGSATDTMREILELVPESLKHRTPLVFGSRREVARVTRYHTEPSMIAERAPLFGNRGLFRV